VQGSPVPAGKNPKQEFKAGRIPGSRFFDVDGISDPNTDLPHMLPSAGAFAAAADALGISAEDQVCALAEMSWTHLAMCESPGQSATVP
jgi:3-mercaptopyruvate sulfurtransferase SseA